MAEAPPEDQGWQQQPRLETLSEKMDPCSSSIEYFSIVYHALMVKKKRIGVNLI
jgi:hypothetical protein